MLPKSSFLRFLTPIALTAAVALPAAAQDELDVIVPTSAQPDAEIQRTLDKTFYSYHVLDMDLGAVTRQVADHQALRLHLGNQTLDLQLELNDLRSADYRAVIMGKEGEIEVNPPVATYKGHVLGDPGSMVRLTILPDLFTGYIQTTEEWLFVDPVLDYADDRGARIPTSQVVVYRDKDVRPDASKSCGAEHFTSMAGELGLPPVAGGLQLKMPRRFDVATEADGQYFQRYGNPGIFNRMSSVLNGVDGIYRSQLNLDLNIVYQQGWPNAGSDPYTSLNAETTLNQFRNWWNANRTNINRDVAHQFSDKNFSGSTIGIAWVGVVCNVPSLAYGISEDQSSSFLNTQLTAHEIGHNFSARHDNQAPVCSGVSCNGGGPIMCSFLQSSGTNSFSNCSRNSIASHTGANGFCLN